MSKYEREDEIVAWLDSNPEKIAALAKATGIYRVTLEAAAQGKAQLSSKELASVRNVLLGKSGRATWPAKWYPKREKG